MKFKFKYIGWFFSFIWQSIMDLQYPKEFFGKYGLLNENWVDFQTMISLDNDPEIKRLLEEIAKKI